MAELPLTARVELRRVPLPVAAPVEVLIATATARARIPGGSAGWQACWSLPVAIALGGGAAARYRPVVPVSLVVRLVLGSLTLLALAGVGRGGTKEAKHGTRK